MHVIGYLSMLSDIIFIFLVVIDINYIINVTSFYSYSIFNYILKILVIRNIIIRCCYSII